MGSPSLFRIKFLLNFAALRLRDALVAKTAQHFRERWARGQPAEDETRRAGVLGDRRALFLARTEKPLIEGAHTRESLFVLASPIEHDVAHIDSSVSAARMRFASSSARTISSRSSLTWRRGRVPLTFNSATARTRLTASSIATKRRAACEARASIRASARSASRALRSTIVSSSKMRMDGQSALMKTPLSVRRYLTFGSTPFSLM